MAYRRRLVDRWPSFRDTKVEDARRLLYFMHMMKTGGTSLEAYVESQIGSHPVRPDPDMSGLVVSTSSSAHTRTSRRCGTDWPWGLRQSLR